jgi:hypothetical protein
MAIRNPRLPTGESTLPAERAEQIAIDGLVFIAGSETLLPRFLALTGIDANSIRKAAEDPAFLGEVLAFILAHEPTLIQFCDETGTDPAAAAQAHRKLSDDRGHEWNSM